MVDQYYANNDLKLVPLPACGYHFYQLRGTMKVYVSASIASLTLVLSLWSINRAVAEERNPFIARVPQNIIEEIRKIKSPIPVTPQNILKGKMLYRTKGGCYRCHGDNGAGDGSGAMTLNPSPRDFTNCRFQHLRTDGELLFVIINGSPGTGMVPFIPAVLTEDEGWHIIQYIRTLCENIKG
jgi:mono/diheme cytochrome c family protein